MFTVVTCNHSHSLKLIGSGLWTMFPDSKCWVILGILRFFADLHDQSSAWRKSQKCWQKQLGLEFVHNMWKSKMYWHLHGQMPVILWNCGVSFPNLDFWVRIYYFKSMVINWASVFDSCHQISCSIFTLLLKVRLGIVGFAFNIKLFAVIDMVAEWFWW